jgi:glycosyltransferase involved in cell wall biosynthesis
MRIGIFSESFEPVQNGVSASVRTLVDELRGQRHHVCILAPHYPAHQDGSPFVLRVPSVLTRWNRGYPIPYPWFPRLRRDFGRAGLEILHSQTPWFLGMLAARLARQYQIPLISTYHTLYEEYSHYVFFLPDSLTRRAIREWMPHYYNRCAGVITPSRVAEESLRRNGVTAPITVIPTAVPRPSPEDIDEAARQAVRSQWGVPLTAPLLLYVGRIAPEKNLELTLDSFEEIGREFSQARLLVAGGGPHLETCKARAREMRAGARVLFAGPTPRSQLDPLYAAADLFVFGSTTETQGLVIAEARAAGTPCVVVSKGGASETVRSGEDGLVVPAERESFTQAIRALLCNQERLLAMREACLQNALDYTPSAMAQQVLGVYERALSSRTIAKTSAGNRKLMRDM